MEISPVKGGRTSAVAAVAPQVQSPATTNADNAATEVAPVVPTPALQDQSTVSGEAQQAAANQGVAAQGAGVATSVQRLVEQLKTDLAAVQSAGQTQEPEGTEPAKGADLTSAKTKLGETYQQVFDQGQLGQVDTATRQSAEQILGIATAAATAQGAGAAGAFSSGILNGLNNLLGSRASA